jgi:hypothetical protein
MPLPERGPWPPVHLALVYDRLASWSAWYGGDPEELAGFYGALTGQGFDSTSRARILNHPSQYRRGGVLGTLARWWWGVPVPVGEKRTKLHVPVASDIASTSADLLFSEPPTLTVEHQPTQDRLDELVDDGVHATLLEAAEVGAALGGVYLRVCWDQELSDRPWLDAVHADAAVPEWRWRRLAAVTFWQTLEEDGNTVVRHLERHEPGAILHGVYEGSPTELGRRVPLVEYPETEMLAEAVTDGDVIRTGLPDRLTAVYWPNRRPNRLWRAMPAAVPLGRSDYAGAEPFMDALDETYSSWMRDIRLAKGRLIVPNTYLQSQGRGKGAVFNSEQEVYEGVDALPQTGGKLEVTPSQFAIRVQEHMETAQHWLEQILRAAGYAVQTFGESREGEATATEVRARERRSFITRDRKILYARPALQEAVETLLAVDREVFRTKVSPQRPDLKFGDTVSEDMRQLAETANLLTQAQAASIEVRVRMVHQGDPDWDDAKIAAEVQAIKDETAMSVPDPASFGGQQPEGDRPATGQPRDAGRPGQAA